MSWSFVSLCLWFLLIVRHLAYLQRFSPCSLRSIRKVLQAKSGRCFSEPEESFCGNLRVEGDEECDAGLLGTEDNDACCDKVCKLRRSSGAVCRYIKILFLFA